MEKISGIELVLSHKHQRQIHRGKGQPAGFHPLENLCLIKDLVKRKRRLGTGGEQSICLLLMRTFKTEDCKMEKMGRAVLTRGNRYIVTNLLHTTK